MATRTFTNLNIKYGWSDGQDSWGSDMNTNLEQLIYWMQPFIKGVESVEPGSPTVGDKYILTGTPSGANWTGQAADDVAIYWQDPDDGAAEWKFITPSSTTYVGTHMWNEEDNRDYVWSGSEWIAKDATYITLSSASNTALGASHSGSNVLRIFTLPRDMNLIAVRANSSALTVTTGVTVDVYTEHGTPASVLTGAISLATALTSVTGTLASNPTALVAGNVLGLRVTTQTGDDVTNAEVVLTLVDA